MLACYCLSSSSSSPLSCLHDPRSVLALIALTMADYREFPSLSTNSQMSSANQASMWSTAGSRLGGPIQRNQSTPLSSQQSNQEDLFSANSSRLASVQSSFRFGNQGNMSGQPSQAQSGSVDDFPPLNRTANGEIASDRGANLLSSLGFGPQAGSSVPAPSNRGNGLLNALSANTRASEIRSPPGVGAPGELDTSCF